MKQFIIRAIHMLFLAFTFWSCQQDEIPNLAEKNAFPVFDRSEYYPSGNKIVLGEQMANPYSLENMKKAANNLQSKGRTTEEILIETTHLYVRFLPIDSLDVDLLNADTTLALFDHPLDFELEQEGDYYHDPNIPDHMPTWQYTVVAVDYEFPDVRYEIIEELFMVDEEEEAGRVSHELWYDLEDEALRVTGFLDDPDAGRLEAKYSPRGRIRVEERLLHGTKGNYLPVKYAKVRARWGVKLGSANTSVTNGTFYIGKRFRFKPRFSIKWQTHGHKVTNAWGIARTHTGPKQKSDWYFDIDYRPGWETWIEATLINNIYDFRTQASRHRIKSAGSHITIKVRPKFAEGSGNANGLFRHVPVGITLLKRNDVIIFTRFRGGREKLTHNYHSLMMHELGHVSHFLKSPINSGLSIGIVNESWAQCVEYYFSLPYYPNIVSHIIDASRSDIIGGNSNSWKYTPFFVDLRDNSNQRRDNGGSDQYADDDVHGYTLAQMQNALDNRTTMRGVQEHLRNNYSNPTENNIERMRDFYEDIKDNH